MGKRKPWGVIACIDLSGCDKNLIKSPKTFRRFIKELVSVIKMKTHGPLRIDRFGQGNLFGYSFMQFIETSSITAHLDEANQRAFIDIFSCKPFDNQKARKFCQKFFKAKSSKNRLIWRG